MQETGCRACNRLRFNRYMVECEYSLSNISFALSLVLIDTWWNVNMILSILKMGKLRF